MKSALSWMLLAIVVAGASAKSYSLYMTTLDDREMMPSVIAQGEAHAPNQYRLLVPLLWRAVTRAGVPDARAEQALVLTGIVFCYAVLAAVLYRTSRSAPITALCLLAFFGAIASGFWFRYRDSFFETAFAALGMAIVVRAQPAWGMYAGLSAVASLNRESWLFSLVAASIARWADAGSTRALLARRRDVLGLVAATGISGAVLAGSRAHYGIRTYHYDLWQWRGNLGRLILITPGWHDHLASSVWFAGSGAFVVWLLFASVRAVRYGAFVVGFVGSLLLVSFLISNWMEARIFMPAYAVMLISISGGIALESSRVPRS